MAGNLETEDGEVEDMPMEASINESKLIFEIQFHSKKYYAKLNEKITSALHDALNTSPGKVYAFSTEDREDGGGMVIKASVTRTDVKANDGHEQEGGARRLESPKKEQSPDYTGLKELFTIDTEPSNDLQTATVPSYKRTIKDVLDEGAPERKKKKEDECLRPRPTSACFNCGGTNHPLRDCPKPRNRERINRAKQMKRERYHMDIDQRFGHLNPGVVSDKLRNAMALKRGELPFFFYRMRNLGYPPGWLENAKVAHSGLSLFTSNNTAAPKPDDDSLASAGEKYDVSKIIDYPGYNVDPGAKFFDDYKFHKVPPFNPNQKKCEFIKSLGPSAVMGYKRKKMKNLPAESTITSDPGTSGGKLEIADMDIVNSETEEVSSVVVFSGKSSEPSSSHRQDKGYVPHFSGTLFGGNRTCAGKKSPTLQDLEARQQSLLQQLQDTILSGRKRNKSPTDHATSPDSKLLSICDDPAKIETTPTTPLPNTESTEIIRQSYIGTPVLKFSPYENLPPGDKFKVGVSDVINFENLPDSTGKYEQMKVVIRKVRNIVTQLNDEDD